MTEQNRGARLERALGALQDEVQSAPAPSIPYSRIEERVASRMLRLRHQRYGVLAAAAMALVVLGSVGVWRLARPAIQAGFEIASASPDFRFHVEAGGLLLVESGRASLQVAELGTLIDLHGSARLQRQAGGVRVLAGTAIFEVEPRKTRSLTVYVSGGRIEVLGTRFTVWQGEGNGELSLERGSIRFVGIDGVETVVAPGDRLRWPPPSRPAPVPELAPQEPDEAPQPPPRKSAPSHSRPKVESRAAPPQKPAAAEAVVRERRVIAEIDRLRMQLEDDRLAQRLDEILAENTDEPLRERVSFERCDLLANRIGTKPQACRAIEQHLAKYPNGGYTARLERARRALGCDP